MDCSVEYIWYEGFPNWLGLIKKPMSYQEIKVGFKRASDKDDTQDTSNTSKIQVHPKMWYLFLSQSR